MRYYVALGAREILVDVTLREGGRWDVSIDGISVEVDAVALTAEPGSTLPAAASVLSLRIDGKVLDLTVEGSPPAFFFTTLGLRGEARVESEWARSTPGKSPHRPHEGLEFVISPMPGRVTRFLVAPNDTVERGTPLVVVEAMKMENELRAARTGRIVAILVRAGDTVEAGAKLITIG